jgi:peptide deformylase
MAILDILHFPDERLRQVCSPVEVFDDHLQTLIDSMFETMYAAPGIGLAAIQVNVHKRLLVADITEDRSGAICLINPEIVSSEGEEEMDEGCLSVPGFYETVRRPERIRAKALNRKGEPVEIETGGLLAVCIQHEIDHLNGKLFVDYISPLKRGRIRKKLEKAQRLENTSQPPTGA